MIRIVLALATLGSVFSTLAVAEPWEERNESIGAQIEQPNGKLSRDALMELIEVGESLFLTPFTSNDGAGRPMATQAIFPTKAKRLRRNAFARTSGPDGGSCFACHSVPFAGGAGDFAANVFVSEGFTNPDFQTTDGEFSNERGSNHIFGAGLLELLAREMSAELHLIRADTVAKARKLGETVTATLLAKGVQFGKITAHADGLLDLSQVDGVDDDLVIRPFSQKGVMTSLRQFSINALNHHHGMQATERFGARWTGETDFDEDGIENEIGGGDVAALTAWQAALPSPVQKISDDNQSSEMVAKGERAFDALGCSSCHVPSLPLNSLKFSDPGPYDVAGTLNIASVDKPAIYDLALLDWVSALPKDDKGHVLVPLFGDLKRHRIADQEVSTLGNELFAQRFVPRDEFMTAELWGVGSTPPYGHRNDMTTLDAAIRAHGGDARKSRDAYVAATQDMRWSIVAFLQSLIVEAK